MIGERTKALFKIWGTGAATRPKAMKTMESYCSQTTCLFPSGFDVTHAGGAVKPVLELQHLLGVIADGVVDLTGDVGAAMRSLRDFVQWLINERKSGTQYQVLMEQLSGMSQYHFQESFGELFCAFGINEDALMNYAMRPDVSYFATTEAAMASWNSLTGRLLGRQRIVMRNENALFSRFYSEVFGNDCVVGDPDGNTEPIKALAEATGVTTRAGDADLRVLINYKLSHIYARPNNPLMFSGVYNFAFTPTLIDAFTEDAQGEFAIRFRHVFREFAHERFGRIYEMFKQFVAEYDIDRRIDAFNPSGYTPRQILKFRQMAHADWSPIFDVPD